MRPAVRHPSLPDAVRRYSQAMPVWISVVFILIVATSLVAMLMQRRGRRMFGGGVDAASGYVEGTLTVTGLGRQNEPDKNGSRYCTISGTIIGPQIAPTEVYGTQVLGADDVAPTVGASMPVVYRPGKVDSTWRFGVLGD
ncbi:hypothetical protein GSI01S_46_00060 [Gordonia sihwensis NBRC 108236]|uniref:DUF3592 domain-containing protein n=2 Tax=Gordonia TaxID=2053 RepID=L7LS35_9ACTN|nr:hypothetical protein GSI01S_46_00060 [Gordonia sihwensis NBRC 108236]